MTTSKAAAAGTAATLQPGQECCMCGDFGLSSELFRCKVCQFRSQHRYCSNLYPKAEAYRLCNWCLSQKDESGDKTQNSFNSSSSNRTNTSEDDVKKAKKKNGNHGGLKNEKGAAKLHAIKNSVKKQRSPERSPLLAARKRITTTTTTNTTTTTTSDAMEDKLRRTKSEEISNGGNGMIRKPVFRNKVRRYKLLDEVSSL